MKKRLKQVHYITLVLLFAVIAGMVLIENENFVGQALKGPLSIRPAVIPAVKTPAIAAPKPCPAGSVEITQRDVDQALNLNQPYVINQPGEYCLPNSIVIDGSNKKIFPLNSILGFQSGTIFSIETDRVVFNLNENSIINLAESQMLRGYENHITAIDTLGTNQRSADLEIRNGRIRGFDHGIKIDLDYRAILPSGVVKIDRLKFVQTANPIYVGDGRRIIITNNRITNSLYGVDIAESPAQILEEVTIENNIIQSFVEAVHIASYSLSTEVTVSRNRFEGLIFNVPSPSFGPVPPPKGIALNEYRSWGIGGIGPTNAGMLDVEVEDNTFLNFDEGIFVIGHVTGGVHNNIGCALTTPLQISPLTSYLTTISDINNDWNAQNC